MMNEELKKISDFFIYPDIPNMTNEIENGQFLDINKTILFKSKQLSMISNMFINNEIKNGDIFFISDIFFPGIESIRYMSELQDLNIQIYGISHAGRSDLNDFVQKLSIWSDYSECGYNLLCDNIFVGSEHHKRNIMSHKIFSQVLNSDNIIVTGQIWNPDWILNEYSIDLSSIQKKDYIIWPHRFTKEKGLDELFNIAKTIKKDIYITSGRSIVHEDKKQFSQLSNIYFYENLSKKQYYDLFSKADYYLNTSYQETFGYTVQEAILFNCKIICANRACLPEMVTPNNLYSNINDIPQMIYGDNLLVDLEKLINHRYNLIKMISIMRTNERYN
jgi:glycosyltransferase involved in cell wall biosynthesis